MRGSFGIQGKFGGRGARGSVTNPATSGIELYSLGLRTDGIYWLNPTGSYAFQAYVILSRDGGGWVKAIQYNNGTNVNTSSEINPGGAWTTSEINLNPGKIRTADITALNTTNSFLSRVTGSPQVGGTNSSDNLFNNGVGTGKFAFTSLPNWGTDLDPTTNYTLSLSTNSSDTYQFSATYTNDTRGRCGHGSSQWIWPSDHNYFATGTLPSGLGYPICWGFYPTFVGTNLHWMSGIGGAGSGGEVYWGINSASAFSIFVK